MNCDKIIGNRLHIIFKLLPYFLLLIDFRERDGEEKTERERGINLLFHLFMPSLVDTHMCPEQGWNLQSWHIQTIL